MKVFTAILKQQRLILTLAILWTSFGLYSWYTMPRQEDPEIINRWGIIVAPFVGADAETVERLILDPIETNLAEREGVKIVQGTARAGVAVLNVELRDDITDTAEVWDEIRRELISLEAELPSEAGAPTLDEHISDQESVVLALTGTDDILLLRDTAKRLKDTLLNLESVSKVNIIADPEEQITIEFEDSAARRLGLSVQALAAQLSSRNQIIPGGDVKLGGRTVSVRPGSDFASLEEIRQTPIVLGSGSGMPLGTIAKVRYEAKNPTTVRLRHNGKGAIGLGIVPRQNINVVEFGNEVSRAVEDFQRTISPLQVDQVVFQPHHVEKRIDQLSTSLLFGVCVVGLILVLTMGVRLGLIVVVIIPMVALSALAIYAFGGGVLHQISIAALVIALGMLVDNAIVVTEGIQAHLDEGMEPNDAAITAARSLALPLGTATGTTLAAFIPMLLARGETAEFTRALPIVIVLTLIVSYIFAIFVTPLLSKTFLKPRHGYSGENSLLWRVSKTLGTFAVRRYQVVLGVMLFAIACTAYASRGISSRFFPASDRNIAIVDVALPEGAHLDQTDQIMRTIENKLSERGDVVQHTSFIGRSTAHFYYNLPNVPQSPTYGQIVVITKDREAVADVVSFIREDIQNQLPEAELLARALEQGPPVAAPIEVRLYGESLVSLNNAAKEVVSAIRASSGTRDVRHNLGLGSPTVFFKIDDAAASRHGLSRSDVALALLETTRGLPVGPFRGGKESVPIVIRSRAGELVPVSQLPAVDVAGARQAEPVPLAQFALPTVTWRPASIHHRNGERSVSVTAQLASGVTFSDVLPELEQKIAGLNLKKENIRLEFGGDVEGSGEANKSMIDAVPIGIVLLLVMLLAEFNSFRRIGIILVTVPLAAVGVVPGMLIADQPFGFMSLLGVFALVGIVVNNAIVLLDMVEQLRKDGYPLEKAVITAVARRTRPILLTTATTVVGLMPLAFSNTTLWPPLAWAMISGLLSSTTLTVLVVPALYIVLFRQGKKNSSALLSRPIPLEVTT